MPPQGPPDQFPGNIPPDKGPPVEKLPPQAKPPFLESDKPDIDAFFVTYSGTDPNHFLLNGGYDETGSWLGSFTGVDQSPVDLSYSLGVALGDINGDGYLDAFVANFRDPNLNTQYDQVLINNGDDGTGVWSETFTPINPTPDGASLSSAVALGDLNNDGYLDAFVGTWFGQPDYLLLNNGNDETGAWSETFTKVYPLPGYGSTTAGVALGDFNADGYLDVVVANSSGANKVLINNGDDGTGTWTFTPIDPYPGDTSQSRAVAVGDLNGDGYLDIFVGTNGANTILINNGNDETGAWSEEFTPIDPSPGNYSGSFGVALGDLNNDGYMDAFIANQSGANQVLINDGDDAAGTWLGSFTPTDDPPPGADLPSFGVDLGDLNGDGYLDAIVSTGYSEPNVVLINDGGDETGTWSGTFTSYYPPPEDTSTGVALGDIDGDGDFPAVDENGLPNINQDGLLPSMYVDDDMIA